MFFIESIDYRLITYFYPVDIKNQATYIFEEHLLLDGNW